MNEILLKSIIYYIIYIIQIILKSIENTQKLINKQINK